MPTRRAYLAGAGAIAGSLVVPAIAEHPAIADPPTDAAPSSVTVTARRTQITLPAVPTLGLTYIATFTLTDATGTAVGTAAAGTSIVDLSVAGPVMLSQVVLRLANGEIHYQRMMDRFGAYPRTATGAVLGGTGDYAAAQGDVHITWPDAQTIQIIVNLRSAR